MSSPAHSAAGAGNSGASSAAGSAGSATSAASASVTASSAAPTKKCSQCAQQQPESLFSGAQLRKGGKRVCKGCVKEQQLAAEFDVAATVTWSTATDQQQNAGPVLQAVADHASSRPQSCKLRCYTCIKPADYHKACGRCSSLVCSLDCFREHRHTVCAAASNPPPLSIPEEDRITLAEFLKLWSQLPAQLLAQAAATARDTAQARTDVEHASRLSHLTLLYPPNPYFCWWTVDSRLQKYIRDLLLRLLRLVRLGQQLSNASIASVPLPEVARHGYGLTSLAAPSQPHQSFATDPSRFLHRLLVLVRYVLLYATHIIEPGLRAFTDVQREQFGVIPCTFCTDSNKAPALGLLAYVQVCDSNNRPFLVPCPLVHPTAASSSDVACSSQVPFPIEAISWCYGIRSAVC